MSKAEHEFFSHTIVNSLSSLSDEQQDHLFACEECLLAMIRHVSQDESNCTPQLDAKEEDFLRQSRRKFEARFGAGAEKATQAPENPVRLVRSTASSSFSSPMAGPVVGTAIAVPDTAVIGAD